MSLCVDLNADLGEGAGHDEDILEFISSANIACGFHAGDPTSILESIRTAHELEVAVGAHPSFPDRANFGRKEMALPPEEIYSVVMYQLGAFQALARAAGAEMNHVKAHGALYNMAARDRSLAEVIVNAVFAFDPKLILFVPPGGVFENTAKERGLQIAREVFADRNYMPDGSLVSRSSPDAFVRDPVEAAERVIRMLREQKVRAINGADVPVAAETICVHGDNPEAVEFVQKYEARLTADEVMIARRAESMTNTIEKPTDARLVQGLGLLDATMIVVGSMIGSGIFIVAAESSRLIGAPGWLLMTWVIAGVLTITGALCCAGLPP